MYYFLFQRKKGGGWPKGKKRKNVPEIQAPKKPATGLDLFREASLLTNRNEAYVFLSDVVGFGSIYFCQVFWFSSTDDVWGDVLWSPHGTKPAAVTIK